MTYTPQKITWTPAAIARHNVPANTADFIAKARKGQNSDSDATLTALHAELMQIRTASTKEDKIQAALSIFKASFPDLVGKGFKFGFRVSQSNGNVVEVVMGGTPYATVNLRSGMAVAV